MTVKTVTLAELVLPKGNPRRSFDKSGIKGLAESIKTDGLLQSLVVQKTGDGAYRVLAGMRRTLALKLLRKQGVIGGDYRVPVTVKSGLAGSDALRIATVENVQREPLDPIDEADAFAALLQNGGTLEEVSAQTGVSSQTVRRRLALANLCKEAKEAVRAGSLTLAVAEALTLGTERQQQSFVEALREGARLDATDVRRTLLDVKPSVSMAIFPLDHYTGTYTRDLFSVGSSTHFDDAEEFMRLQEEAVEQKAKRYRKQHAFVEVLHAYSAPWWQYRNAEDGEQGGVVLNLSPSGSFEMKKNLVKNAVRESVVAELAAPTPPKERAPYGPSLLRYVAHHKSIAVQAALAGNRRKLREVALVLLLTSYLPGSRLRIDPHSCIGAFAEVEPPRGYLVLRERIGALIAKLELTNSAEERKMLWPISVGHDQIALYESVARLSNAEIDEFLAILPVLSFGQESIDRLEQPGSFFARVSAVLGLAMRKWWTPDGKFLSMLKRTELERVAIASGASLSLGRLSQYTKRDLVLKLAAYFSRTTGNAEALDEHDQLGTFWLPELMRTVELVSAGQASE